LNTINFVFNNVEDSKINSDLIIIEEFSNAKKIFNNIMASHIFSNVKFIKREKLTRLRMRFFILFPKIHLFYRLGRIFNLSYNQIACSGWDLLFMSFAQILKGKSKMIIIDDGLASYSGDVRAIKFTNYKYKLLELLNIGPLCIHISALYLNNLSVYRADKWTQIKALPSITANGCLMRQLDMIFSYAAHKIYQTKYIFIDDPHDSQTAEQSDAYGKIFKLITKTCDKVIVRPHPADYAKSVLDYKKMNMPESIKVDDGSNMWELVCNHSLSDNNVLINIFSTAVFNPKLLFNKEPFIIFLCNIFNGAQSDIVLNLINFLKNSYKDKWKIFVPNSLNEFANMLEKVNAMVGIQGVR